MSILLGRHNSLLLVARSFFCKMEFIMILIFFVKMTELVLPYLRINQLKREIPFLNKLYQFRYSAISGTISNEDIDSWAAAGVKIQKILNENLKHPNHNEIRADWGLKCRFCSTHIDQHKSIPPFLNEEYFDYFLSVCDPASVEYSALMNRDYNFSYNKQVVASSIELMQKIISDKNLILKMNACENTPYETS